MFSSLARHIARNHSRITAQTTLRHFCAASNAGNVVTTTSEHDAILADFDNAGIRTELNKLRELETDLMSTLDEKTVPIDWDHWKNEISYPNLVEEVKQIYDDIPPVDIDQHLELAKKKVDEVFDPIIAEYEQVAKESEASAAALEKEIEKATFMRDNIKDLSVEEFLEKYPSFKKSVEDDILNNRWFVDQA